jgi:hypothetical protein
VNDAGTMSGEDAARSLRLLSGWFLATAVLFFPLISDPLVFGFFDAGNEAERVAHTEEHLTPLRLLFTAVGVAELSLGGAIWAWGRRVAAASPGGAGVAAGALARVPLAAGSWHSPAVARSCCRTPRRSPAAATARSRRCSGSARSRCGSSWPPSRSACGA